MKIKTKLTKIGRNPLKQKGFINPGTYKGSTMIFNTFKDYLNDIKNFDDRTTFYGINKNPFHKQLEDSISFLYNCNDTVLSPSGLASIVIPFFTFLKSGETDFAKSSFRNFQVPILQNGHNITLFYIKNCYIQI